MCGIMGYKALGHARPQKEQLEKMFVALQSRGKDASGFAYYGTKHLHIHKKPIPATDFINTKAWKRYTPGKAAIFHTRAATQGDAAIPHNNHPLAAKDKNFVIVHNGVIYNYNAFDVPDNVVDSTAIVKALETSPDIKTAAESLEGSFSIAQLTPDHNITLIRKNNPLVVCLDPTTDIMYFASETKHLIGFPTHSHTAWGLTWNTQDYITLTPAVNSINQITNEGWKELDTFTPKVRSWNHNYHNGHSTYYGHNYGSEHYSNDYACDTINTLTLIICPHCESITPFGFDGNPEPCEFCNQEITQLMALQNPITH